MKKIIFGFICSALTLSLFTGCGDKELEKTDNNEIFKDISWFVTLHDGIYVMPRP